MWFTKEETCQPQIKPHYICSEAELKWIASLTASAKKSSPASVQSEFLLRKIPCPHLIHGVCGIETHTGCGLLFQKTEDDRRQREEHTKMGSPQEEDYTTLDIICTSNEEG